MLKTQPNFEEMALSCEKSSPLTAWFEKNFPEVDFKTFYRELFPSNFLGKEGEIKEGKYRSIALQISSTGKVRRHSISDGLQVLDLVEKSTLDEFWIASPISYAGNRPIRKMARHLYAIAIDLDGVRIEDFDDPRGLGAMFNQINHGLQPRPTYIVSSGTGLHMYYFLEEPLCLYPNVLKQLQKFRRNLIKIVWSSYVTDQWQKIQYEAINQGFRMVGTGTKVGNRVRAFRTGERVSIEYLNFWLKEKNKITDITYKSELSLEEAKQKYPVWYEKRIVKQDEKNTWTNKRALYDWWFRRVEEASIGHRYFYLMCLAVYAKKCEISKEELEKDAWSIVHILRKQDKETNKLSDTDIEKALGMYDEECKTFSRKAIQSLTAIPIKKNKRNYRKQALHLRLARSNLEILNEERGEALQGRPLGSLNKSYPKRELVRKWRLDNPGGSKADCVRATGLSKPTVYKWW